VGVTKTPPPEPITIEPVKERLAYDIEIPITKPLLVRNVRKLGDLDPLAWTPIWDQADLDEPLRVTLRMQFAIVETEVHQADLAGGALPLANDLLGRLTRNVMRQANVSGHFAELYPIVRGYVAERCFGRGVDLDDEVVRSHLRSPMIQDAIGSYLARMVGRLTVEQRPFEVQPVGVKLSETKPFQWRRNLTPLPLTCTHTIFNFVATYNNFERRFAEFLDAAPDVVRFASLGTTEQGDSATRFRVDYLKPSGAIGVYHPDWVVVQQATSGEINWIIETKGRVWESTKAKDDAMAHWCEQVVSLTGAPWRYVRVDQAVFDSRKPGALADLTEGLPLLAAATDE
jgi:type III restriction enzyme